MQTKETEPVAAPSHVYRKTHDWRPFDPGPGSYLLCVVAISKNMPTRRVEEAETNKMVYQLYGLTDEEKQLVENVGDVPQPIVADSHIY